MNETEARERIDRLLAGHDGDLLGLVTQMEHTAGGTPGRINADPENVERGLAQLVLTLVELLRQVMERQAVRRMERGTLSDDEVERLGIAFLRLDQRMEELLATFELERADLQIHLGPLGNLLD